MSSDDRLTAVEVVEQAVRGGARRQAACEILGISVRTLQRWETEGGMEMASSFDHFVADNIDQPRA